MKWIRLFSAYLAAAMLAGCGSTIGQTETFNCCVDKQFYSCPDQTSFNQCSIRDVSACNRDTTQDVGCPLLWPSGTGCCLGGEYYSCEAPAAFSKCFLSADPRDCKRNAVKDNSCPAPWPG